MMKIQFRFVVWFYFLSLASAMQGLDQATIDLIVQLKEAGATTESLDPPPNKVRDDKDPWSMIKEWSQFMSTHNAQLDREYGTDKETCARLKQEFKSSETGMAFDALLKAFFVEPDVINDKARVEDESGNPIDPNADNVVNEFEKVMWHQMDTIVKHYRTYQQWLWFTDWNWVQREYGESTELNKADDMVDVKATDRCEDSTKQWMKRALVSRCNDVAKRYVDNFKFLQQEVSKFYGTSHQGFTEAYEEWDDWFFTKWGLRYMSPHAADQMMKIRKEMQDLKKQMGSHQGKSILIRRGFNS